ncbi:MAG: UDP-2,3-diacylglucosamine diphosphatase [Acidobacteriota bacterium]
MLDSEIRRDPLRTSAVTPPEVPAIPFKPRGVAPADSDILRCRTAFISDTHLGFASARPRDLVANLRRLECEKLYLVGDIIDMWQVRRRWRWCDHCDEAVSLLLGMAQNDTDVVFVPGNHDDAARRYLGLTVGGARILGRDIHGTADGRRLLVTHGDQYDLVVKHSKLLCMLGNVAYDGLIRLNRAYNVGRRMLGLSYWSLSHFVKLKVKSACTFISRFEETLAQEARRLDLDGVVCGHIHKAEVRELAGVGYYNCGDWVESCTLLVERFDGSLEIVDGLGWADRGAERAEDLEPIPSLPASAAGG